MDISSNYKTGILLQGKISEWTVDIIKEYQNNFPSSTILLSTWTTENVENIPCDVIQIQPPDEQDQIGSYTINHQNLFITVKFLKFLRPHVLKTKLWFQIMVFKSP